jgi:N-acetylmuramoyl-L-alanine amidase
MLVLHYTGMRDAQSALERMCDPKAQVSAHYMIDEDGTTYALVDETRRAWHAGAGSWRGHDDINARSIGIELVNPGHEFGYRPFPMPQMEALAQLAPAILARHPIPPRNVIAHADLAPARKDDPGELFDWQWLAERGIGLWPQTIRPVRHGDVVAELTRWGYAIPPEGPKSALVAFQRHFRPNIIDGVADEETIARLMALLAQTGNAP